MARRIRWQIVIALLTTLVVTVLLGRLALRSAISSPLSGGVYTEALVGRPTQLIPLLNDPLADPVGRDLAALLFDGLMRVGADGLMEPALAASYQLDESQEVYTFFLRDDVRWHDGQPFSADDVIFTIQAIQEQELGDAALVSFWQRVLVDRIDNTTVRFTLDGPYAPFLNMARLPILPAHLLRDLPPDQWASSAYALLPIGTGPYFLSSISETAAQLQANTAYYGGAPLIERLELRFVATIEAAAAALTRGEVQALGGRAAGGLAEANLPSALQRSAVPLDEYVLLSFNLRNAPLDNQGLRQALAYGLDKDALIETALDGLAAPIDTPIVPGWWAYDATKRWYQTDQALAGQLLGEQGYEPGVDGTRFRDGQPLRLELITDENPRRIAVAEGIARQWAAIGVAVQVVTLDGTALLERLSEGRFTMALHSWVRLGPEPDVYPLWHSSQAEGGFNYAGLRDPEIDVLLENARDDAEIASRAENYAAFQARWIDLAPSITLYRPLYLFIADTQLGGLGFDDPQSAASALLLGPEDRYRSVSRWYVNSAREIDGSLP
jgi:peptide/nickel transport system substrate-binding protein